MLLYILLDLNIHNWNIKEDDPFSVLQIYINAYLIASPRSTLRIMNSFNIIYDSSKDQNDYSCIIKYYEDNRHKDLGLTPNDLGLAILSKPCEILIFSSNVEDFKYYLGFLKCMFAAQKLQIKINALCLRENLTLKMCSTGTGGVYLRECTSKSILSLLGTYKPLADEFSINCICCSKRVLVGLVCPICLSVYCKFVPVCRRCKSKFEFAK